MEPIRQSKTAPDSDDTFDNSKPNGNPSGTDSCGATNQNIVTCPYCNGTGHVSANLKSQPSQATLLRRELIKAYEAYDALQKLYQETVQALNEKNEQRTKIIDEQTQTIDKLKTELKDTKRQLMVHENYNNPSSTATIFAKKRKKYRRTVKLLNEGATLQETQNSKGKRGRRVGAKGTSPVYTPDPSKTKEFAARICGGCGRTDTTIHVIIWKVVVDIGKCGKIVCYMEKIMPAYCSVCRAVTYPETDSIPGTWAGPNIRRIIMNIHGVSPTVRGISKLLYTNHNCVMSDGAVSNCLSAISAHIREGTLLTYVSVSEDDTPMPSGSKPPTAIQDTDIEPNDNPHDTI